MRAAARRGRRPDGLPNAACQPLMMLTPLILAVLQGAAPAPGTDSVPWFRPDSATIANAYADPATRELVRLAREHHGMVDASVFRYRATMRQRVSVGVRALRRDRLVYRRETAFTVDWRRDGPGRIEVLGAREAVPIAVPGLQVPDDLDDFVRELVPKPGADRLVFGVTEDGFAWHPLVAGGEAVYDYAIGETTEIRLPDARVIRLIELRVTPRERDIRLITGSFWIDADSHAIVQAVFRPSREFDLERDLARIDPSEADEADEVPGILKPIRLDVRYMTVDYGLWELRWWMPRLVLVDGSLQVGPAHFPVTFEIAYSDYQVEGDRYGLPELPPVIRKLAGDPSARARPFEHGITVVLADTAALLASPLLPESLYERAPLVGREEMRALADRLDALPPVPWTLEPPRFSWPWQLGRGLLRYNTVEGLSAGARLDVGLGRARADLTARLGSADLEPRAELGLELPTLRRTWRVAGYHRLAVADPSLRPLDLGSSLNALTLGRDDGSYFRATGGEITITPAAGEPRYRLRIYAERQEDADPHTDFSIADLFGATAAVPPDLEANPATQVGLDAALAVDRGLDPQGFRWGFRLEARAEAGDFTFLRPGVSARVAFPLFGDMLGAVEAAAGTILGPGPTGDEGPAAPRQSLWYLGGPATLRGFGGAAAVGPAHVRGRLELATALPAARLALFSDAGWAGEADAFETAEALISVGVGASFLDGLLRVDLAHTLRPAGDWRLEAYTDGLF